MAEPLRGILVGLGPRGVYWLTAGLQHPDVRWVGGVTRSQRNRDLARAAGAPAGRLFPRLDQALAAIGGEADFALDATPPITCAAWPWWTPVCVAPRPGARR